MIKPAVKILSSPRGPAGAAGSMTGPSSAVKDNFASFGDTSGDVVKDSGNKIIDEDDMASDLATAMPSQQSVKKFVEDSVADVAVDIHAATAKNTPVDADEFGITDSAASWVLKKVTLAYLKIAIWAGIKFPEGFIFNGKIVPSVASTNLTVALKGQNGSNPSATNPVYVMINGTLRSVTATLSVTKNAATNWCNAGSTELATKEIDYFVYLGYNATDGVVIGFSRFPGASSYNDFSVTTTNEKYCAISTITTAAATDYYNVIGRFAATLSAGAGYTWTVPTYTAKNLIQRPIYETRELNAVTVGNAGLTVGDGTTNTYKYQMVGNRIFFNWKFTLGSTSAVGDSPMVTAPFSISSNYAANQPFGNSNYIDTGTTTYKGYLYMSASNKFYLVLDAIADAGAATVYPTITDVHAAIPHTWANTDIIEIEGNYPI